MTKSEWKNKRCPFGISTYCITDECGAWREYEGTKTEGHYIYDESDSKPGLFSDWKVYETLTHGGFYTTEQVDSDWGLVDKEVWVPKSKSYKIRKWIEGASTEGGGYCKRMT